jgi:nitrosocyanin
MRTAGVGTLAPAVVVVALLALGAAGTQANEIALTVVNIESPQGVKVWVPASVTAKKGDKVSLRLLNKHPDEHGYEIAAYGVKEVVELDKVKTVTFTADKAGIFPIKCHLHPAHVTGQLVVLD